MITVNTSHLLLIVVAYVGLLVFLGCTQWDRPAFDQELQVLMNRDLFEQIDAGRREIEETIPKDSSSSLAFELDGLSLDRLDQAASEAELLAMNRLQFFHVTDHQSADLGFKQDTYVTKFTSGGDFSIPGAPILVPEKRTQASPVYFQPGTVRMIDLRSLQGAKGDLLRLDDERFAVFRSLPVWNHPEPGINELAIFRIDFRCDPDGVLSDFSIKQITQSKGNKLFPSPTANGETLYYLSGTVQEGYQLVRQSLVTGEVKTLWPDQKMRVGNLRLVNGEQVLLAANPDGYYRVYELVEGDQLQLLKRLPKSYEEGHGKYFLHQTARDGQFEAKVMRVPDALTLSHITALVKAHNLEINRYRALLAASLAEVDRARLNHYPTLSFGVVYTPAEGIVLDQAQAFSGDFVAQGIARGLLGLTQPILDIRRNELLRESSWWRAKIAEQLLLNEINEKVAEAAELYLEAQYMQRKLKLDTALLKLTQQRIDFFKKRQQAGGSLRVQMLAAKKIQISVEAEQEFHRNRYEFLMGRLRRICGMEDGLPLQLSEDMIALEDYPVEPAEILRQVAMLNHPRVNARENALYQAFFLKEAGPAIRPTLEFGGLYGQSWEEFQNDLGDFLTLSMTARLPLAAIHAQRMHDDYWKANLRAMKLEWMQRSAIAADQVEEARLDFITAQADHRAKAADRWYHLELARVLALEEEYGPAELGAKSEVLGALTGQYEYLRSLEREMKVEHDLALRFVKLWREQGQADRAAGEMQKWASDQESRHRSLWLWRTKEVMATQDDLDEFFKAMKYWGVSRVYAYMYSDALLLKDEMDRGRFVRFLEQANSHGIEVWALLGEPEWLDEDTSTELGFWKRSGMGRAVTRIHEFNEQRAPYAPRIHGVKIDLEPHSKPGWNNPDEREKLKDRLLLHLAWVFGTRGERLQVAADVSVKYVREQDLEFWELLEEMTDFLTLMAYDHRPKVIEKLADEVMVKSKGPIEIGVEFSSKAPKGETLYGQDKEKLKQILSRLRKDLKNDSVYAGISLHDWAALKALMQAETKTEDGTASKGETP